MFLVAFFHIRTIFYRKPKWSVWSIWTHSTVWILKFVIQKVSFGRKLKLEVFENTKNQFGGPKLTFEAISKTNMISKYILDHSAVIPAQFPYIITSFSIKITGNRQNQLKSIFLGSATWPEALKSAAARSHLRANAGVSDDQAKKKPPSSSKATVKLPMVSFCSSWYLPSYL